MLPIFEALVGAAVLFGLETRRTLLAGSILMLILMFGSTLREDWPTVGIQLTYSLVYCILIAGVQFDGFGIDRLKKIFSLSRFCNLFGVPLSHGHLCKERPHAGL